MNTKEEQITTKSVTMLGLLYNNNNQVLRLAQIKQDLIKTLKTRILGAHIFRLFLSISQVYLNVILH